MDYKRLNQAQLQEHDQVYRGGPLHHPSSSTTVETVTDPTVVSENSSLKKELKAVKSKLESAVAATKELDPGLKEMVSKLESEKELLSKEVQELKDATVAAESKLKAAVAERDELADTLSADTEIPEVVFLNEVTKIRPLDDNFTKVYGKISTEKGGKEVEGVVIVANEASKHLKRIGV